MSTKYDAQLNHIGFDWFRQSNRVHHDLLARETVVLEKLGFYAEHGPLDDPMFTGHIESIHLMEEISGKLSKGVAILMDGGFKPPHQIIATLMAVEADPSLILNRSLEPEALGVLASCYQRANETPGTFWYDIDRQENAPLPEPSRVRAAATAGILKMKAEAAPGRRKDWVVEFLALQFREIFLRFNVRITRHSLESQRDGKEIQIEGGPFIDFLREVLEPLNPFFSELPKEYGAKPISAAYVARVALKLDIGNYRHKFGI
jgi:hypothetical protein